MPSRTARAPSAAGTDLDGGVHERKEKGGRRTARATLSGALESAAGRRSVFSRLAKATALGAAHPLAFLVALLVVLGWALSGPLFGFSDTWQLVINTATTVITFLMVFLIQSTQNRDTQALQIKLDELIRVTQNADTALLDLEELEESELQRIQGAYEELAAQARLEGRGGRRGNGSDSPAARLSLPGKP